MPRKQSKRRGGNRATKTSIPKSVISMTPMEAFESNLARGGDSCVVRTKSLVSASLTTTPSAVFQVDPGSTLFGSRLNGFAAIFTSYRLKQMTVKFINGSPSIGVITVGLLDDGSTAEGDAPTTVGGVLELRCSASSLGGQTTPSFIIFRPVDPRLWFKTISGATGSDQRLVNCAVLYAAASSAASPSFEIDAEFVFKGAYTTST